MTTTPRPLSPAAQAVLDAAKGASAHGPDDCLNDAQWIAAAALRAAADAVAPEAMPHRRKIRAELHTIANELDPRP